MSFDMATIRPKFAVFLDIDGVLNRISPNLKGLTRILIDKFGEDRLHVVSCDGCHTCALAQSHLFYPSSIDLLRTLIEKMNKIAEVHIVISSAWRLGRTVNQLKEIFKIHNLAQYIVDKTLEEKSGDVNYWKDKCIVPHYSIDISKDPSRDVESGYMFSQPVCRAGQINEWICSNPGYAGFVVFDDIDYHMTTNFGDKFISTDDPFDPILTFENTEKAYQCFISQLNTFT